MISRFMVSWPTDRLSFVYGFPCLSTFKKNCPSSDHTLIYLIYCERCESISYAILCKFYVQKTPNFLTSLHEHFKSVRLRFPRHRDPKIVTAFAFQPELSGLELHIPLEIRESETLIIHQNPRKSKDLEGGIWFGDRRSSGHWIRYPQIMLNRSS